MPASTVKGCRRGPPRGPAGRLQPGEQTSSPTPSRVFAALRRHGLALLVPCSILAITFGGYRDNLQKEEASQLLLFQAQAGAGQSPPRTRRQPAPARREAPAPCARKAPANAPTGSAWCSPQYPGDPARRRPPPWPQRQPHHRRARPARQEPATAASLRDALPALGGKPLLSAPMPSRVTAPRPPGGPDPQPAARYAASSPSSRSAPSPPATTASP